MPEAPACRSLGAHCHALKVTLRVAELEEDDAAFRDAAATWLLGHTEKIDFGTPRVAKRRVLVDATLHAPCRYLKTSAQGMRCTAHGFTKRTGNGARGTGNGHAAKAKPFVHQDGSVTLMQDGRMQTLALARRPEPPRSLAVLHANPCVGAPCRTADNRQGAACCRDLTLDIVLPAYDTHAEALLETRRAPYVCKVTRMTEDIVECEVISACGYLGPDEVSCQLHDRLRPDGSPAKPCICSDWPDIDHPEDGHPGCRLLPART